MFKQCQTWFIHKKCDLIISGGYFFMQYVYIGESPFAESLSGVPPSSSV